MVRLCWSLALAAAAPAAVVEGVVADAPKQEPLRKAVVTLRLQGESRAYTTTTDSDGRFRFPAIPEGRYSVRVSRRGYLDFRGLPGESGPAFVTARNDGESRSVRILLRTPGAVSGEVVDEEGAPFVGGRVRVRRIRESGDEPRFTWTGEGRVDDEGRFRVYGLPPGRYIVDASPAPQNARGDVVRVPPLDDPRGARLDQEYLTTYYPNSPDPSQAAPLRLGAGEERSGVYIRLRPRRALSIAGIVLGGDGPRIDLIAVGYGGTVEYLSPSHLSGDGEFELRGLGPGSYVLVAQAGQGSQWRGAFEKLSLTDAPVENLELELRRGVTVEGLLMARGPAREQPEGGWVTLSPDGLPGDLRLRAEVNDRGRFAVERVLPGRWKIEAEAHALAGAIRFYLREVEHRGLPLLEPRIIVDETDEDQAVLLEMGRTARLSGLVLGAEDPGTAVAWMTARGEPGRLVAMDADGRFLFESLEPGGGRLLALEGFNPDEPGGPDFWRNAWTRGGVVTLEDGGAREAIAEAVAAEALR